MNITARSAPADAGDDVGLVANALLAARPLAAGDCSAEVIDDWTDRAADCIEDQLSRISALAERVAELEAERECLIIDYQKAYARATAAESNAAALREKVAALTADAERYRLLRSGELWPAVYGHRKWSRLGAVNGRGDQCFGDELDALLDAARLSQKPDTDAGSKG